MDSLSDSTSRMLELEARQDAALRQLDELERQLEQLIAEQLTLLAATRVAPASGSASAA